MVGLTTATACEGRLASEGPHARDADVAINAMPTPNATACAPTPTQLVDFNTLANQLGATGIGAMQLASDTTNLYFVFGGALLSVQLKGGPVSTLLDLGQEIEASGILLRRRATSFFTIRCGALVRTFSPCPRRVEWRGHWRRERHSTGAPGERFRRVLHRSPSTSPKAILPTSQTHAGTPFMPAKT